MFGVDALKLILSTQESTASRRQHGKQISQSHADITPMSSSSLAARQQALRDEQRALDAQSAKIRKRSEP